MTTRILHVLYAEENKSLPGALEALTNPEHSMDEPSNRPSSTARTSSLVEAPSRARRGARAPAGRRLSGLDAVRGYDPDRGGWLLEPLVANSEASLA